MRLSRVVFGLLPATVISLWGCSQDSNVNDFSGQKANVQLSGESILIVDRTGKKWDVTHAVKTYGFVAEEFQFGLGPNAITPILNPQMLSPGDPGYPADFESFLVIGTELNGDIRAYPISVMTRHEIADERFDSTYVAVAY